MYKTSMYCYSHDSHTCNCLNTVDGIDRAITRSSESISRLTSYIEELKQHMDNIVNVPKPKYCNGCGRELNLDGNCPLLVAIGKDTH